MFFSMGEMRASLYRLAKHAAEEMRKRAARPTRARSVIRAEKENLSGAKPGRESSRARI